MTVLFYFTPIVDFLKITGGKRLCVTQFKILFCEFMKNYDLLYEDFLSNSYNFYPHFHRMRTQDYGLIKLCSRLFFFFTTSPFKLK